MAPDPPATSATLPSSLKRCSSSISRPRIWPESGGDPAPARAESPANGAPRDRVALVTGGGSGIGRATALHPATEGTAVAVAGHRAAPLAESVVLIEQTGGRGLAVPGNRVCPGIVDTPLAYVDRPRFDEREQEFAREYPLGRLGSADDVADAVAYLASPDASWVTGSSALSEQVFGLDHRSSII